MNNLSSYRGLVDAKIRASDKDLPVRKVLTLNLQTLIEDMERPMNNCLQLFCFEQFVA